MSPPRPAPFVRRHVDRLGGTPTTEVRLVPFAPAVRRKRLGLLRRKLRIRADFDAPLPDDVLAGFEGGRPYGGLVRIV